VGRPRWLSLVKKCQRLNAISEIEGLIPTDQFKKADTNARFNLVLAAFSESAKEEHGKTAP
jgi:hypothetical protein